ncbi:acetate--CoA ligase family protein [Chloroflexota bacterium]
MSSTVTGQLEGLFHPRSIAVMGASTNPASAGYRYVIQLKNYGFKGAIYPINPKYPEILGLKAYPSIKDVPGSIDYVISCLGANMVPELLAQCPEKQVKMVHLFTGRFSETGNEDAARLEKSILQQVKTVGVRMLGPNCMGLYYPKEGIAFNYDCPKEPGPVGFLSQSGGGAGDFVFYASLRGIRFSKLISYGNALDLNESDFLEYFAQDSETQIIAAYIEGVKDGQRFLTALRQAARSKPVVIVKAGRSGAGRKQAFSHTSALAGSNTTWEAAIKQTGAIQVRDFQEMMDVVLAFSFLPPVRGNRVGVVGGGGGASVLSADEWEEAGFNLPPLPPEIEAEIKEKLPPLWLGWMRNPLDSSIFPEEARAINFYGRVVNALAKNPQFDVVIANVHIGGPASAAEMGITLANQTKDLIEASKIKPVVVIQFSEALGTGDVNSPRWKPLTEMRTSLVAAKIPAYPSIIDAARALKHLIDYYQRKESID